MINRRNLKCLTNQIRKINNLIQFSYTVCVRLDYNSYVLSAITSKENIEC